MKRLWRVRWLQDGKQREQLVAALSVFGAISHVCIHCWGEVQTVEAVSAWLDSED